MGETSRKLLEKLPIEKCWAITAKTLTNLNVKRAILIRHLLSTEEGVIAPIMAWEKFDEILTKIMGDGAKKLFPWVKKRFNISVEDAIGAYKLEYIANELLTGPEGEDEVFVVTPKRVVVRWTQCAWWKRNIENGLAPGLMVCPTACQAWGEEGVKAVNPKITCMLTKAMLWGDPYCEFIFEFKED